MNCLQSVLQQDARNYLLATCVDASLGYRLSSASQERVQLSDSRPLRQISDSRWPSAQEVAGLTPWDPDATAKAQLEAASPLHALAGTGTVALSVPEDRPLSAEELVDLLRYAWQQTEVVRVRLVRKVPEQRQLTAPWETRGG